jgi:hypothetical protein
VDAAGRGRRAFERNYVIDQQALDGQRIDPLVTLKYRVVGNPKEPQAQGKANYDSENKLASPAQISQ